MKVRGFTVLAGYVIEKNSKIGSESYSGTKILWSARTVRVRVPLRAQQNICRSDPPQNHGVLHHAELAQLVERWLPKPKVASSSLVFRSNKFIEKYCASGGINRHASLKMSAY